MLKKDISLLGVFSIASGAMISSGIFVLPGLVFLKIGSAIFLSYFIAGVLGLMGIFSVIELSTAMPKAGGDYYFINKTFGPLIGTISGILGWFALSLKSSFAIFGISEIIYLYGGINPLISGLILVLFFVVLNLVGVKETVVFQIIMVVGLLLLMLIYIVFGVPNIDLTHYNIFAKGNIGDIFMISGFVFISFGGLLNVSNISEEVINPKRNIPLGMILSIVVVTIFYTLITFIITGTLSPALFEKTLTPVADSAKTFMGSFGYVIIIVASTLAFFTTANAGVMSASRYPLALSRDKLLPQLTAVVNKRFNTPTIAIILTGVVIYLSLLLPLETLVKVASTVILLSYLLTNLSVIIFRESKILNYKPSFKAPLYPWLQILCVVIFSFFIFKLGMAAVELSLGLLFISFVVYFLYGKKVQNSEYALLHLIKKITDKRLINNIIEDELRDIIINRDEIEQDNFDHLIKDAKIIDIENSIDFEDLVNIVVDKLPDDIDIDRKLLTELYLKRQNDYNTALSDFVAIPHILIEGENKMFLEVVRAKNGVKFTNKEDSVKAIFFLGGTRDKKTLHLKALASIATLVDMNDFQQKWLDAKDTTQLKNMMLLSKRKRFY